MFFRTGEVLLCVLFPTVLTFPRVETEGFSYIGELKK